MATCTHCGKDNPDGARFCNHCGRHTKGAPFFLSDLLRHLDFTSPRALLTAAALPFTLFGIVLPATFTYLVFQMGALTRDTRDATARVVQQAQSVISAAEKTSQQTTSQLQLAQIELEAMQTDARNRLAQFLNQIDSDVDTRLRRADDALTSTRAAVNDLLPNAQSTIFDIADRTRVAELVAFRADAVRTALLAQEVIAASKTAIQRQDSIAGDITVGTQYPIELTPHTKHLYRFSIDTPGVYRIQARLHTNHDSADVPVPILLLYSALPAQLLAVNDPGSIDPNPDLEMPLEKSSYYLEVADLDRTPGDAIVSIDPLN